MAGLYDNITILRIKDKWRPIMVSYLLMTLELGVEWGPTAVSNSVQQIDPLCITRSLLDWVADCCRPTQSYTEKKPQSFLVCFTLSVYLKEAAITSLRVTNGKQGLRSLLIAPCSNEKNTWTGAATHSFNIFKNTYLDKWNPACTWWKWCLWNTARNKSYSQETHYVYSSSFIRKWN